MDELPFVSQINDLEMRNWDHFILILRKGRRTINMYFVSTADFQYDFSYEDWKLLYNDCYCTSLTII